MSYKQLLADGTHGAPGVAEAPKYQPAKTLNAKRGNNNPMSKRMTAKYNFTTYE